MSRRREQVNETGERLVLDEARTSWLTLCAQLAETRLASIPEALRGPASRILIAVPFERTERHERATERDPLVPVSTVSKASRNTTTSKQYKQPPLMQGVNNDSA